MESSFDDCQQEKGGNSIKRLATDGKTKGNFDKQVTMQGEGYSSGPLNTVEEQSFKQQEGGAAESGADATSDQVLKSQSRNSAGTNDCDEDIQPESSRNSTGEREKNSEDGQYSHPVEVADVTISVPGKMGNLMIIEETHGKSTDNRTQDSNSSVQNVVQGADSSDIAAKAKKAYDHYNTETDHASRECEKQERKGENLSSVSQQVETEDKGKPEAHINKQEAIARIRQGQTYDEEEDIETGEDAAFYQELHDRALENYVYFWKSHDIYSQWHKSEFKVDGHTFNCAEQFMMFKKADLFGDQEIAKEILQCNDPRKIKALGRQVKGFQSDIWQQNCLFIVKEGNRAKFTQKDKYLAELLLTYPKVLVEASPYDSIWGIGLDEYSPGAWKEETWQGTNYLGYVITEVRDDIMVERGMIDEGDKKKYIDKLLTDAGYPSGAYGGCSSISNKSVKEGKTNRNGNKETLESSEGHNTDQDKYLLFSHGIYSQFHHAYFEVDNKGFSCAEQYMMFKKAVLFEDYETANKIMKSDKPKDIKQLGRKVKGFSDKIWQQHCLNFVKEGNIAKFSQNEVLKKAIVITYPKIFVEANPYDRIWGIGLHIKDKKAQNKQTWQGKNFLGYVLTEVRDELMCKWGLIKEEKKLTYIDKLKDDWGTPVDGPHVENKDSRNSSCSHQIDDGSHRANDGKYRTHDGNYRAHDDKFRTHDGSHQTYDGKDRTQYQPQDGIRGMQGNDRRSQMRNSEHDSHGDLNQNPVSNQKPPNSNYETQKGQKENKRKGQWNSSQFSLSDEQVNAENGTGWKQVEGRKKHDNKRKKDQNVPNIDNTKKESTSITKRDNKNADKKEHSGHTTQQDKKHEKKFVDDFDINDVLGRLSEKDHVENAQSSPKKSRSKGKGASSEEVTHAKIMNTDSSSDKSKMNTDSSSDKSKKKRKRGKKHGASSGEVTHAEIENTDNASESREDGKGGQQNEESTDAVPRAEIEGTQSSPAQGLSRRQKRNKNKKNS